MTSNMPPDDMSEPSQASSDWAQILTELLEQRFGERLPMPTEALDAEQYRALAALAGRSSHRQWAKRPVDPALLRLLVAVALSAPSKSDLQQAELVHVQDPQQRAAVQALVPSMPWMADAPVLLVVCGTGRRFRRAFERQGLPFVNEHLDGVFNPVTDAAMVLMNLLGAAGAAGLVGVPISVLRDQAPVLSELLALPDHCFPVAGLCLGYPLQSRQPTPRFGLSACLHVDRHAGQAAHLDAAIDEFDRRYATARQQFAAGSSAPVRTWSQDKSAQYATTQRGDWGRFLRHKGFSTD